MKASTKHGRKTITEMEDGVLVIHFHDDNALVIIRFALPLGRRAIEVAVLDDASDADSARLIPARVPASR